MNLLAIFQTLFFTAFLSMTGAPPKAPRPNIIVILADDLGYADVGFNGGKDVKTPNLDILANNGTVCTSAYVAHPFCGPSRAGLMTGRYPHTFGSQFNLPANSEATVGEGIPLSETFISDMLKSSGYHTGIVGKWHLGAVPDYHPNKRGFDDFYGFLGGGHNYFPKQYQEAYERNKKAGQKVIWDYLKPLEHNGQPANEKAYLTDELSNAAVNFVQESAKKDKPFFLYLAYNAPHAPLEATDEDKKLFMDIKDPKRRTYAAMVYAVDRGVGELVKALKAANQFDNTLIVFLSDNGGELKNMASNYPLTGSKGDTNEGGYRVPMLFHWTNNVPKGKHYEHPVTSLDFYPTFAGLAGAEIPKSKQLDGKDIWAALKKGTSARKGEMIFAMRHRSGFSDVGARQDQWKILKTGRNKWQLFDIDKDITEQNDMSAKCPKILKEMVLKTEKWSKTHTEPRWFDPEELGKVWKETEMAKFKGLFKVD